MRLDQAIVVAADAHAGQFDQRGDSYFLHPLRVMRAVPSDAQIAAVLHDVVERSATTLDELAASGLDETNVAAVDLLSRPAEDSPERPSYDEYIERIVNAPGEAGRIARTVKVADLNDKLSRLPPRQAHRAPRYRRALATLTSAMTNRARGARRTRSETATR